MIEVNNITISINYVISSNNMVATNFRYPFASIPIAILIFVCAYFVDVVIKKIPLIGKRIV